jgi:acetoin:2,6-dichlorophenolindophenol oxidoreductase subunit alpha
VRAADPGRADATAVGADTQRQLLEAMVRIRAFETAANQLYLSAKMPGLTHLYIGEEAVAVGVCSVLRVDDVVTSTHRGHGHCIAKGADVQRMFCELLGKEEGYCRGKGGSMHIADHANGNLGANAIVGGSAGIATGAAFAAQRLGSDRVAVCFFGDGALGQGLLYEVMNMASLWKLPVVYVCENNLYNEYTHYSEVTAGSIPARAEAFGIPTEEVDGQDVLAVRAATQRAVERARAGDGPSFLLAATYRYHGHHVGDIDRAYYRKKEEEELWVAERDPIDLLAARIGDAAGFAELQERIDAEISDAVAYALDAPYPAPSEVTQDVFA